MGVDAAVDEIDYRRELASARSRYSQYLLQRSAAWRKALYASSGPVPGGYDAWGEQFPPQPYGGADFSRLQERQQLAAAVRKLSDPRVALQSGMPPEDYLMQLQSWRCAHSLHRERHCPYMPPA